MNPPSRPPPLDGHTYILKLLKFLSANRARLSQPPHASSTTTGPGNLWQQSYTLLTLGLDPSSSDLSWNLAVPLTLGFGGGRKDGKKSSSTAGSGSSVKPLTLRLPPDRLLFLLLLFQSSPSPSLSQSPNIGPLDIPVPPGVHLTPSTNEVEKEGDVTSVRSWVGSLRSVGLGSWGTKGKDGRNGGSGWGWFGGKKEVMDDDARLRAIYAAFTILPSLIIHPPSPSDPLIKDLVDESAYTSLGGIDIRVPLNVFRGLWSLELEGYDPRGLWIPPNPGLKSLTVRDVQDGEDWLEDLLGFKSEERSTQDGHDNEDDDNSDENANDKIHSKGDEIMEPRFPNLRHLALPSTSLLSIPILSCPCLTHLDLSNNLLNAIPPSLSSIHTLQTLNLSNNMIDSVRGANLILGQVHVLNLRNNRIDCLSGLDRVLGLERIDLRKNRIMESAEVGRLALLPLLKEIWVGSGNGFVDLEEDWRVKVFVAFAEEGREVEVDGYGMSWGEERAVEGEMKRRGRRSASRGRERVQSTLEHTHGERLPVTPQVPEGVTSSIKTISGMNTLQSGKDSPTTSILNNAPRDKRRRQRIVDLDGSVRQVGSESEDGVERSSGEVAGRSARALGKMPIMVGRTSEPVDEERNRNEDGKASMSSNREQVTASAHAGLSATGKKETQRRTASSDEAIRAPEQTGEELRAKIEALKLEVGDSWLKVLTGQAKDASQSTGNGDATATAVTLTTGHGRKDEGRPIIPPPPPPSSSAVVVQVVSNGKGRRKKKAAASARIE